MFISIISIYLIFFKVYLIDSGFTVEVGLNQLYVIDEELLKIPPQAFLMLLDVDIEEPFISNDELNAMVKNTVIAFRLSKFLTLSNSYCQLLRNNDLRNPKRKEITIWSS